MQVDLLSEAKYNMQIRDLIEARDAVNNILFASSEPTLNWTQYFCGGTMQGLDYQQDVLNLALADLKAASEKGVELVSDLAASKKRQQVCAMQHQGRLHRSRSVG